MKGKCLELGALNFMVLYDNKNYQYISNRNDQ